MIIMNADEDGPGSRHPETGRHLRFGKGQAKGFIDTHHLSGGLHFRSKTDIRFREAVKRKNGFLDGDVLRFDGFGKTQFLQTFAQHHLGGQLCQRHTDRLADKRHRARSARIDFQHIQGPVFHSILNIHEADHVKLGRQHLRLFFNPVQQRPGKGKRRKDTGAVARMYSRFFDMLHNSRHNGCPAVTDCVHVHFNSVLQKLIDQNRVSGRNKKCFGHERFECFRIVDDFHRTSTQHVGWTDQNRVTDAPGRNQRLPDIHGRIILRLIEMELVNNLLKPVAVFRTVNGGRRSSNNRHTGGFQAARQIERCLASKLNDNPVGFFCLYNMQNVFQRHRLEKQFIRCVVIRADSFRIGVDHDALDALLAQGKRSMDTTIIKFNALSNPVWTAADDRYLLFGGWP